MTDNTETTDLETRLRKYLANTICYARFEKLDGTERTGHFTLQEAYLSRHYTPSESSKTREKKNIPGQIPVFDTDINQWRILTVERLKEFSYQDTYSGIWNSVIIN